MNEEILRIQKMVAEGKIAPEEAVELIESGHLESISSPSKTTAPDSEPDLKEWLTGIRESVPHWPISKAATVFVLAVLAAALLWFLTRYALALLFIGSGSYLFVYHRRRRQTVAELVKALKTQGQPINRGRWALVSALLVLAGLLFLLPEVFVLWFILTSGRH